MKVEIKNKPWKHFVFKNFFSEKDWKLLKNFPKLKSGYETITGFRESLSNRFFLNDELVVY